MRELYGPLGGIIAGILGFLTTISIAGMDLLGISIVFETFLQSSRSAMPSDKYRYLAMPSDSKKLYESLF